MVKKVGGHLYWPRHIAVAVLLYSRLVTCELPGAGPNGEGGDRAS